MPPHAYGKRHVRLSLVSFPVQLVLAIDTKGQGDLPPGAQALRRARRYETVAPEGAPNVINLMEALKRSLKGSPRRGFASPADTPPAVAKKGSVRRQRRSRLLTVRRGGRGRREHRARRNQPSADESGRDDGAPLIAIARSATSRGDAGAGTVRTGRRGRGSGSVVQKHAARRLHYDFRLELNGTLRAGRVTRVLAWILPLKRLAVHVEDSPPGVWRLRRGGSEGPVRRRYGDAWERGRWGPLEDLRRATSTGS